MRLKLLNFFSLRTVIKFFHIKFDLSRNIAQQNCIVTKGSTTTILVYLKLEHKKMLCFALLPNVINIII